MMALLPLSALELTQHLRTLAQTNVLLEVLEAPASLAEDPEMPGPEELGATGDPGPDRPAAGEDSGEDGEDLPAPGEGDWFPEVRLARPHPGVESDIPQRETLIDYLLWQLDLTSLDPHERAIAWAVVEGIDERTGYLTLSEEEIRSGLSDGFAIPPDEIESVRRRIQSLDPAGVGSRTLVECLTVQLELLPSGTPGQALALRWLTEDPGSLAHGARASVARRLAVPLTDLEAAWSLIRSLKPRPADGYLRSPDTADYVVPDLRVSRSADGHWVVSLEGRSQPQLRLDPALQGWIRDPAHRHEALRTQLREARWLIRGLELRNQSLIRLAQAVVDHQEAFFTDGDTALRPLSLRQIAPVVGLHETTVSRLVHGKYLTTPRGLMALRRLFSVPLATEAGPETSAAAVRARLRAWLETEDPAHPATDDHLAHRLAQEGIMVARRTVAKYRESLGFPPFRERLKQPSP
jgi:RNA polymerase sigma-54 factor